MPGVIIFDPDDNTVGFSEGDDQAASAHLDIENDALYICDLSNIIQWEGDSVNNMTYTWRSGILRTRRPVNMGAGIVQAEAYTDTIVRLYAELSGTMTLIQSIDVMDDEPFRLPGGYTANVFEIEVVGTDRVTEVAIAQSIFDLAGE